MSTTTPELTPIDRASDWLNPILVKETRQSLKSRQFVATFMLMLLAAWLISVFGIVVFSPGVEYKSTGGQLFIYYYFVLAVAIFIIVPFGAFRSLLSERDLHTWEVLSITTLKPRQIVWGKLTSAVVQLFIYYSAITPFIAFANLLKGIDVPTIVVVLVGSLVWSMALSMIALTLSTFGSQRIWQVFLTLVVLVGLIFGMFMPLGFVSQMHFAATGFDEPSFWWFVGACFSYIVAFCALFMQIAVAQLTFDADNRSSGIRIATAVIFWMTLLWLCSVLYFSGVAGLPAFPASEVDDLMQVFTVVGAIFWFIAGLFAATEPEVLSRRVRRNLLKLGPARLIVVPLIPGGSRGLVYVLLHVSVMSAFTFGTTLHFGITEANLWRFMAAVWCYLVIFLGLGSVLSRVARSVSGDFRPAHARVLTVLAIAMCSILPQGLRMFDAFRPGRPGFTRQIFFASDPVSTLIELDRGNTDSNLVLTVLVAAAVVSLLFNLRAMLVGIADVVRPYVPLAPARPREMVMPKPATAET